MVITVEIENLTVMKMLIDQGSSVDILYWSTFKKLQILKSEIQTRDDQIVGFSGERFDTRGYINLYTKFGEGRVHNIMIKIRYLLVEANTSYNVLLDKPSLNQLRGIVSTPHLVIKFPSSSGDIIIIHVDQKTARECYIASRRVEPIARNQVEKVTRERSPRRSHLVAPTELDPRTDDIKVEHGEDTRLVPVMVDGRTTKIGTSLSKEDVEKISLMLQENADVFAWTAVDMLRVDPSIIVHKLSTYKDARPVAQNKRKLGEEKRMAARTKAQKLL